MTDFEALMQEPPGGGSHSAVAEEFLQAGGWSIVDVSAGGGRSGGSQAGMTTHRGVNAPTEHVDEALLLSLVEQELGHTLEEITSLYQDVRPSAYRARIRAQIDARFLALSRSGGNMTALAGILGWRVRETPTKKDCWQMQAALRRARAAEVEA